MATVGGKNTGPEMVVRRYLHARGYRFRLHRKDLPGKPDLVLPKYRLVIFVHGCYWHRHSGCFYASTPKTRIAFWQEKFERNLARDWRQQDALIEAGWRVLIVWQCGLRHSREDIDAIETAIVGSDTMNEWPAQPPRTRNDDERP
ncbi:very short patch repair endonuclease [Chromohalobacter nigrandesensis]|uniref:very short patch repair endonuclease n=1 Tax=Chromohalobacter nigrandesensis TaxID=119863 RepID=UPI001FF2023E|nr:DNA mismatch endonuclease Vsr [Chromohalobacter nigrandesensis]MCK0743940.1 DNA mismatch endonuclease Vsr [Chromohalobacter nigrandesensis]